MNKSILIGRLTGKPEMTYDNKGGAIARFSLAVPREYKRDEVDFIPCVTFGKRAETLTQYTDKGSKISVTGSIRMNKYDAKDGTKRISFSVVVDGFEFLDTSKKNEESVQRGNNPVNQRSNNSGYNNFNAYDDMSVLPDDGDMPF